VARVCSCCCCEVETHGGVEGVGPGQASISGSGRSDRWNRAKGVPICILELGDLEGQGGMKEAIRFKEELEENRKGVRTQRK
jgi:hypothetical protein